jgi:hypothetical protein
VAGVVVDAQDKVYVFNRGEHPVVVFDHDGNLLRTFGEGLFSQRPHSSQLAESHLTGGLFRQILGRIERLAWHPT